MTTTDGEARSLKRASKHPVMQRNLSRQLTTLTEEIEELRRLSI